MSLWYVGALLAACGSIASNLGVNIQKYSFLKNARLECDLQRPYIKQPLWALGLGLVVAGSLGDFAALGLAAQSIVAPIGSITLVSNVAFAHWGLGEPLSKRDIIGTFLIIFGSTISVAFGNHTEQSYTLSELEQLYLQPGFIAYACIIALTCLCLYLAIKKLQPIKQELIEKCQEYEIATASTAVSTLEKEEMENADANPAETCADTTETPAAASAEPPTTTITISAEDAATTEAKSAATKLLIEQLDLRIAELETIYHPYERFHPFAYCALSGCLGAQSILFGKMLAEMIGMSLRGNNQMIYPVTYVFLLCMLFSIFSQLHFLALGLSYFDALYVVPVFQCFFISVSTLGGAAYFSEFSKFRLIQFIVFPIGIMLTLAGVYLLSSRQMKTKGIVRCVSEVVECSENGTPVKTEVTTCFENDGTAASNSCAEEIKDKELALLQQKNSNAADCAITMTTMTRATSEDTEIPGIRERDSSSEDSCTLNNQDAPSTPKYVAITGNEPPTTKQQASSAIAEGSEDLASSITQPCPSPSEMDRATTGGDVFINVRPTQEEQECSNENDTTPSPKDSAITPKNAGAIKIASSHNKAIRYTIPIRAAAASPTAASAAAPLASAATATPSATFAFIHHPPLHRMKSPKSPGHTGGGGVSLSDYPCAAAAAIGVPCPNSPQKQSPHRALVPLSQRWVELNPQRRKPSVERRVSPAPATDATSSPHTHDASHHHSSPHPPHPHPHHHTLDLEKPVSRYAQRRTFERDEFARHQASLGLVHQQMVQQSPKQQTRSPIQPIAASLVKSKSNAASRVGSRRSSGIFAGGSNSPMQLPGALMISSPPQTNRKRLTWTNENGNFNKGSVFHAGLAVLGVHAPSETD